MTQASVGFGVCPNHPDTTAGLQPCARCGVSYCTDCLVAVRGRLHCATCKDEQLRDLAAGRVGLPWASVWARLGAQIMDGLILGLPMWFIAIFLTLASVGRARPNPQIFSSALMLFQVFSFVVAISYEALLLTRDGQTLGKKLADVRVVRPDGSRISAGQAWGRALARVAFNLTCILGPVDVLMVFSSEGRTLHDRVARTRVVSAK